MVRHVECVKTLKARYFRFVDTKDWDALRALFVDDAEFTFPGLGRFERADDGVRAIRTALGDAVTVHHGHAPEIELVTPDEATGIWAMDDLVIRGPDAPPIPGYGPEFQRGLHGYGHYHETYRREGSWTWRIASLRLERLHIEPLGRR